MTNQKQAAVVVGALALLFIGGCSGSADAAGDGSFAEISGSPVAMGDELTQLCEQIVTQALPVDAALVLAESNGYPVVLAEDAAASAPAAGEARMVLEVEADIVVGCTVE